MQELEKILEEIELEKKRLVFYPDCSSAFSAAQIRTIEKIEQIICKYMSNCKRMNDGWIPVGERLPEESGYYRVTVKDKELGGITEETAWFAYVDDYDMDESEWRELYEYEEVIAWRELAPYNPERSNDEKE